MKIGIFGSAFNPPTYGHIDAIKQSICQCDHLYILPSYSHPLKSNLINYNVRIKMISSLINENINFKNISISRLEEELSLKENLEKVFTFNVINKFRNKYPCDEIIFFVGEDNYYNFDEFFYKSEKIKKMCKVICLKENLDIRSSYVRKAVTEGNSVKEYTSDFIANLIVSRKYYKINQ